MITTICKISYGSQTVPPIVTAVQGDTGRAINFELSDFTPPAGATATYFILKPSGEAIYNSATIADNNILCELTAQSLAETGENRMQVRVLLGEDIVTSFEVILMVRKFLGDDAIESGTEMNIFDQAVEQAAEDFQSQAEQIVEGVIESIPADYTELTEEVSELNERLGEVESGAPYAPAIVVETEEAYTHENVNPLSVTFIGNDYAFKPCRYADHKNEFITSDNTDSRYDVEVVHYGHFFQLNGADTSASRSIRIIDDKTLDAPISAGTYTVYCDVNPGDTQFASDNLNLAIYVTYEGSSSSTRIVNAYLKDTDKTYSVTLSQKVVKLTVIIYYIKNTVYDNFTVFYGMYPTGTVFVNTEETIADGETFVLSDDVIKQLNVVDTVQHVSNITTIANTKQYVDNLDINVYAELPYLTPELFGAVGDGVEDDYEAVQACLDAMTISSSRVKCVRGYNKYKVSQGITIHGRDLDVYFNRIDYMGNDAAITIHAFTSQIRFSHVVAIAGDNAVGIRCSTLSESAQENGFSRCRLECDYIITKGNNIELISTSGANDIYYNEFHFLSQYTYNGHVIYINGGTLNENVFYGKHVTAPNGYLVYNANTGNVGCGRMVLRDYCIEQLVKFGIYNGIEVSLINCRTEEFLNHGGETDPRQGRLFVFDGATPKGCYGDKSTLTSFYAFDVSDALSFEDVEEIIQADQSTAMYILAERYLNNGGKKAEFEWCPYFGTSPHPFSSVVFTPGNGKVVLYYNNVAYKPSHDVYFSVDDELFTGPDYENQYFMTPTFFEMAASADIHLDPSYCCIAIDEFLVKQYDGKKATIYDKNGNLLFDGTSFDAGTYKFKCIFKPLTKAECETITGRILSDAGFRLVYTGTNETWVITKVDDVTPQ